MAEHNDFGKLAEDLAADFLVKKGHQILVRNYTWQKADVDIISLFEGKIVATEVKARQYTSYIEPHEAVNKAKMRNIVKVMDEYMKEKERPEEVQFDIIAITPDEKGVLQITHFESAFEAFDAN